MKTELSSFDVAVLIHELNQTVRDAYIDTIYQLNRNTLLLKLRQPSKQSQQLLIQAGKRLHLTGYAIKKPQKPTAFCMALRKHLTNSKILGVQQHEFERIVTIRVGTREGDFQLITELFGEGNIILVNPQNVILYALTYRRMRDRNILRGEAFKHAPSSGRNPLNLSRHDLDELKGFGRLEVVRALTKLVSIGGLYAEEVLLRAKVDKTSPCESLTEQELGRIFAQLRTLLAQLSEAKTEPRIVVDDKGEWVDATPIRLEKHVNLKHVAYKTFNEAVDEYFTQTEATTRVSRVEKELESELSKLNRVLQDQQKTMEEQQRDIEQNRLIGDLIYAHMGELQLLLQKIIDEKQKGKTWEQIVSEIEQEKMAEKTPSVYFHSLDSKRRVLSVSVEGATFPLDIRHSVQATASGYYERAKKAQKRLEGARKAMLETQAKIRELQQQKETKRAEEVLEIPLKRRERAWYEKFRWFHSSDGFLVIGGRDATTNEILIKKHTQPHDIVLHADIMGASFVVVKTEGKTPPEQTIKESAQLAASYSSAWRELSAVDVYWVHPEQVSKSPPPGQYLSKGTFMIHGAKNYIRKVPLRLAIGVLLEEEKADVIGGPVEAVTKQTRVFVQIAPGQQKSSALAKQVKQLLTKKVSGEWQKRIQETPVEEIQRFIPYGRGMVVAKP